VFDGQPLLRVHFGQGRHGSRGWTDAEAETVCASSLRRGAV
jgi:hypothetical protein